MSQRIRILPGLEQFQN